MKESDTRRLQIVGDFVFFLLSRKHVRGEGEMSGERGWICGDPWEDGFVVVYIDSCLYC